jgi:cell division protein FtsW
LSPRDGNNNGLSGKGGNKASKAVNNGRVKMSYAVEETLTETGRLRKRLPHMRPLGADIAPDFPDIQVASDMPEEVLDRSMPEPQPLDIVESTRPAQASITAPEPVPWRRRTGSAVGGRRTADLEQLPKQPADPQLTEEEEERLTALEMRLPRKAGKADPVLLIVVLALVCIGLVMVYSASSFSAARDFGDAAYYFQKQLLGAGLGVAVMFITMRIDYRVWRRFSLIGLAIALPLLALVLFVGSNVYGATRWLPLGFFSFQPSELIKLVLALYIADWLARKGNQVGTFLYGLAPFVILVGLILGLVLLQKDMGTACVIAVLAVGMFFTAGANIFQFVLAMGAGMLIFLTQAFKGYRYYRLIGFIQPFQHTTDINLQLFQSLLALGSGGWLGVGLGASRQKTGYLPFPFIDSIFAIIGEELGFIGCMVIIVLFAILAFRGFRLARRTQDIYGALLATGITTWLVVQAMINIGASTGTIPYTGVPLPFISFGGTSMVISLAAVGVLLSISRYIREPEDPALSRQTIEKIRKKRTQ